MPKKNRLTGAEIRSIRSPRRLHGGLFSLSVSASRTPEARFACVVSKKVAAKAVARNLIKRRCRTAIQGAAASVPRGSYVFYAKKEAARASYALMAKDIAALMREVRSA